MNVYWLQLLVRSKKVLPLSNGDLLRKEPFEFIIFCSIFSASCVHCWKAEKKLTRVQTRDKKEREKHKGRVKEREKKKKKEIIRGWLCALTGPTWQHKKSFSLLWHLMASCNEGNQACDPCFQFRDRTCDAGSKTKRERERDQIPNANVLSVSIAMDFVLVSYTLKMSY